MPVELLNQTYSCRRFVLSLLQDFEFVKGLPPQSNTGKTIFTVMSALLLLGVFCAAAGALEPTVARQQLQTVKNKNEITTLRFAALRVLVKEKEKEVLPLLKELALNPAEDQKIRILAIQSYPEFYPAAADELMALAEKYFLSCLLPFEGDREGEKWIKFNPKEMPYIIEFMCALGKTGRRDALPCFILPTRVKETRPLCPLALGEMGKPAVPFLLSMLDDEDVKTRKNAVNMLGKIGDKRAVPALIEVLKEDNNIGVRMEAANNLVLFGDKNALPCLEEAGKNAKLAEEKIYMEKAVKTLKDKIK